jgi:hypothetical protein
MESVIFKIATEFSKTPGPRYIHEGPNSGELLRTTKFHKLFVDAIQNNKMITVDLDNTAGYGTSFLEEIFGGLIREHHLDYNDIMKHLTIVSNEEPYLIQDIFSYLDAANEKAVVTA